MLKNIKYQKNGFYIHNIYNDHNNNVIELHEQNVILLLDKRKDSMTAVD